MYSGDPTDYQKHPPPHPPPPPRPPPPPLSSDGDEFSPSKVTTGIPVRSQARYYADTVRQIRVPWSSGLCDCTSDCHNCCVTCWCPCITFGQIAEIVDKGSSACGQSGALYTLICCVTGCQCFYSCFYRSKLRQQYMLKETPCNDCLLHCFCEQCALCQEYRELKHRGYDLSIGWHGNVERRNRGVTMNPVASAPPPVEGMTR